MSIGRQGHIAIVRVMGSALLVVGVGSALVGPAETHAFTFFREGGRFHYEGFGFGSLLLDGSIATTVILTWGLVRRQAWAWWCAVVFLGLLLGSSTATFLTVPPSELVTRLSLAPLETQALSGIPMRGYHLAVLFGVMPAATLAAVVIAHRSFASR